MKKIALFPLIISLLFTSCKLDTESQNQSKQTNNPLKQGIELYTKKITRDSTNSDIFYQRSQEYLKIQAFDEAIQDLKKAIQLNDNKAEYYHQLSDVYMDYFRSKLALKTIEDASFKFPNRIPTLLKLSETYLILKNYNASMRTLDRIEKIDPLNSELAYMRGVVYENQGDLVSAVDSYQTATENNPDLIEAYLKLGEIATKTDNKNAITYFDNALRIDPNNVGALMQKAFYTSNVINQVSKAQEIYREIITLDPNNNTAFFNSGLLYMDQDSFLLAKRQFTFAVKVRPIDVKSYYYRAIAQEAIGDISSALDDYQQVIKMSPGFQPAKEAYERLLQQVQK